MVDLTPDELRATMKDLAAKCGSQKALADALHVSEAYLSDVLNGRREPGEKMLAGLGFDRIVVYRPHGKKGQTHD